ncbi:MAG: zinc ribbon domain-containing protein [Chloroflexota bacterium]
MSEIILCRNCNAENPRGSKYCNNCGDILPPSTNILCPSCQTPNSRDRLYCDECGTRLVEKPIPPPKPVEEQPAIKRFDLPSRAPGDTSDLDPATVPDWLRTGERKTDTDPPLFDEDEDIPATLHDLEPLRDSTDELPSWLVEGEEDVENLFGAPREITTDHYLEMVQSDSDDEPDDTADFDEEDEESGWLTASAAAGDRSWLEELGPVQTGVFADTDESRDALDATTSLPDLPDWLTDIGPAHTGQLDHGDADSDDSNDWLEDFKPAHTGPLVETEEPFDLDEFAFTGLLAGEETEEGDLPDWLLKLSTEDNLATADFDVAETSFPEEFAEDMDFSEGLEFDEDDLFAKEDIPVAGDEGTRESDVFAADDAFTADESFLEDEPLDQDIDIFEQHDDAVPDWLSELESAPLDLPAGEETAEPDAAATDDPWLDDTFDFGEALEEDSSSDDLPDRDMPAGDWGEFDQFGELDEPEKPEPTLLPSDAADAAEFDVDDYQAELPDIDELGEEDEIPEWVSQLGPTSAETGDTGRLILEREADDLARNEDLPDWITEMMPDTDYEGPTLSGLAMIDPDYVDPLEGIPEELASAELPDWLQDAPAGRDTGPLSIRTDSTDIPPWLQQVGDDEESAKLSAELSDLLGPPVRDKPPKLSKAEIPEWLEAYKPAELTGEPPEGHAATSGPLSGMKGTLEIEPLIARPRTASANFLPFSVSEEQKQQVDLLQQIIAAETETQPVAGARSIATLSLTTRLGLALLLLLAVLFGLWGPGLFTGTLTPTPAVVGLHTAVDAAAGQPVLLVFDYTPALAGELGPQADMLVQQLARNGSPVISLSQYTAGERLADLQTAVSHPNNRYHLGYLPGEAIGVRQLGTCLAASPMCDSLVSRTLSATEIQVLADVSLVIILTGERDNLVNWIEQLAVYEDLTLAAGVTRGLRPVATPYLASGQLTGLLSGLSDTAAYQSALLGQTPDNRLLQQQNAQGIGQLLAAFLLLVGLFVYARRP